MSEIVFCYFLRREELKRELLVKLFSLLKMKHVELGTSIIYEVLVGWMQLEDLPPSTHSTLIA